jgi:sulfur carrier protein
MKVIVNGAARELAAGTTVAALLVELELAGVAVAVERNQRLVPRTEHAATVLVEGDRIELVTLVGGG